MKQISIFFLIVYLNFTLAFSNENKSFEDWKKVLKLLALSKNISKNTLDLVLSNLRFLPKVIEYDRFQPEFYEDTKTYISKRTSIKKLKRVFLFINKIKI